MFGEVGVDGTGDPWEYLDGWAYRVDGSGPAGTIDLEADELTINDGGIEVATFGDGEGGSVIIKAELVDIKESLGERTFIRADSRAEPGGQADRGDGRCIVQRYDVLQFVSKMSTPLRQAARKGVLVDVVRMRQMVHAG